MCLDNVISGLITNVVRLEAGLTFENDLSIESWNFFGRTKEVAVGQGERFCFVNNLIERILWIIFSFQFIDQTEELSKLNESFSPFSSSTSRKVERTSIR